MEIETAQYLQRSVDAAIVFTYVPDSVLAYILN